MALVVGITGPTCAGKSTLVSSLVDHFTPDLKVVHFSQDLFYRNDGVFEKAGEFDNWDVPSSFRNEDLRESIRNAKSDDANQLVIVDGICLLGEDGLDSKLDIVIYLELSIEDIKKRRFTRDEWLQKNAEYFDLAIVPAFQRYCSTSVARSHPHHHIIDASLSHQDVFSIVSSIIAKQLHSNSGKTC